MLHLMDSVSSSGCTTACASASAFSSGRNEYRQGASTQENEDGERKNSEGKVGAPQTVEPTEANPK